MEINPASVNKSSPTAKERYNQQHLDCNQFITEEKTNRKN
jgi:hypothetical protein